MSCLVDDLDAQSLRGAVDDEVSARFFRSGMSCIA